MSFSEQPNEILDMLLNTETIPLPQRMRLRAVSRRWLPVLEDGLARENTLVIRDGEADYPKSKPDDLVVQGGSLTEEFIQTLSRLFPSPTELSLAFGEEDLPSVSWSTVPSLLAQMGTNLTTVKLYGSLDEAVVEPLAGALADISNLTSFTLDGYDLSNLLLPFLGPVLLRLEAFVCPDDDIGHESASLISSSLSPRCARLLLAHEVFATLPGPFLARLSSSLMHLSLVWCEMDTVWAFLSQMHGLTSLSLGFDPDEFNYLNSSLLCHLAPFARLTDLKLSGLVYVAPLDLPSKKETPFATIKRLTLEVYFWDENDLVDYPAFFEAIGAFFPVLTQLTIITYEETFPDIQASLDKLPFSVETVDNSDFFHTRPDF